MKDLIISATTNYTKKELNNYIKSIDSCGFKGDKIMVVYNTDQDTIDFLKEYGWNIYKSTLRGHIHMHRLISMYLILRELNEEYRFIISTDVRDVIFQRNPSEYLESNLKRDILVSSENVLYKDEPWGTKNIKEGYNEILFERYKNELTCNVGVLAGKGESIKDLLLLNYLVSQSGDTQHFTDQSSFNFIIHNKIVKENTQVEGLETTWAIQLGTLNNEKNVISDFDINIEDYTIVHQYDRIPKLNTEINKRYK